MGVFCTPVDRAAPGRRPIGAVPTYTVTGRRPTPGSIAATERGISAPVPARTCSPWSRRPTDPGRGRRSLAALAVHYFPGMWTWDRSIVEPAGRGGLRPSRRARRRAAAAGRLPALGPDGRRVHARSGCSSTSTSPSPTPPSPTATSCADGGERVRYRDRVHLALLDDEDERCWLMSIAWSTTSPTATSSCSTSAGCSPAGRGSETELALPVAGMQYTELRVDPPGPEADGGPALAHGHRRRRRAARPHGARHARRRRRSPTRRRRGPTAGAAAFRNPCVRHAARRGCRRAAGHRLRAADRPTTSRRVASAGVSWGMGRGAAPRRF